MGGIHGRDVGRYLGFGCARLSANYRPILWCIGSGDGSRGRGDSARLARLDLEAR